MKTVQHKYRMHNAIGVNFDKAIIKAVDEGLSVLGEVSKQSLYLYLERFYGIQREEIPVKITDFVKALEEIFGLGSKLLLLHIMKSLHRQLGMHVTLCSENLDFVEYVRAKEVAAREFIH
ncbi:MAG: hypothetical protein QXD86_04730 [Candidatus Bathyarchaeia archaeon]